MKDPAISNDEKEKENLRFTSSNIATILHNFANETTAHVNKVNKRERFVAKVILDHWNYSLLCLYLSSCENIDFPI